MHQTNAESVALPRADIQWTSATKDQEPRELSVTIATSLPSFDEVKDYLSPLPVRPPYRPATS